MKEWREKKEEGKKWSRAEACELLVSGMDALPCELQWLFLGDFFPELCCSWAPMPQDALPLWHCYIPEMCAFWAPMYLGFLPWRTLSLQSSVGPGLLSPRLSLNLSRNTALPLKDSKHLHGVHLQIPICQHYGPRINRYNIDVTDINRYIDAWIWPIIKQR